MDAPLTRRTLAIWVVAAIAGLPTACSTGRPESMRSYDAVHDVVVYGGTSAGVVAATRLARDGYSVVLIEPGSHLGGLTSGGLGMTDTGDRGVIGGMSRDFYRRVQAHYRNVGAWVHQRSADFRFFAADADTIWRFEPRVAEQVFRAMIREAGVQVWFGERLDRTSGTQGSGSRGPLAGVQMRGSRIMSVRMESGRRIAARIFVDATYEGDLMAAAGVTYVVGRESNEQYGETLNGVQTRNAVKHQFVHPVDPYIEPGVPASGLLPGVHGGEPGIEGAADHRVQAYCFRMCLTDAPPNRLPYPKPADYDPLRYELLLRYIHAGWRNIFGHGAPMPNRKTDTNNNGAFSTDNIGMNYDYPDGDYATRARIVAEHESYQKGLMWFLANDPRVPQDLQTRFQKWGLAKDEFVDNGHWPHQLYIREARRMVSDWVQTELDCRRSRETPQPIGMGSYNMDSHNVQRYVDAEGHVRNEGDIQVSPGGPYPISYLAIRPRREECTNLLVPVCLSASHAAYGSIRMEPVFMILAHSAAVAASIALTEQVAVQDVEYDKLRTRLLAEGQILSRPQPR